jgi:hypothetical protein
MPLDPDQPDIVREALAAADSVDASAIRVDAAEDAVVLRGSVATFEEASAAAMIAEQHADLVRSELTVDTNLRESAGLSEDQPPTAPNRDAAGSSFNPVEQSDDVVTDLQESLTENVPWDPPHEAVQVPTRAEERGRPEDVGDSGTADDVADDDASAAKSLPDLTPEELARAAHPQPRTEEDPHA